MRDRLPVICSAPKVLKKFAKRAYDFEDAHEQAVDAGADSAPYRKACNVPAVGREAGSGEDSRTDARARHGKKVEFELDKIARRIEVVRGKLKSDKVNFQWY